jgi:hypothetical protein
MIGYWLAILGTDPRLFAAHEGISHASYSPTTTRDFGIEGFLKTFSIDAP